MTETELAIAHINYQIPAIVRSKNEEPMYYIHKYWARKPHNVVAEYILHYSREREIVLDPFAGSGVTALEAVKLGRKGIAIDINPIGNFITYATAIEVDLGLLQESFDLVIKKVQSKVNDFYETACKKCGQVHVASHYVWQQNKKSKIEEPIQIYYFCKKCNPKGIMVKKPDLNDLKKLKKIESQKILAWYPKIRFEYPSGKKFLQLRHDMIKEPTIEMLYTKRNLHLCALIFEAIDELPETSRKEKNVKDVLKLTFTAFIAKSSKMNIINVGGYSSKGRGWTLHFFWNPTEFIEQNPLEDFKSQFETTLAAKEQTNKIGYRIAKDFEELKDGDKNILILNASALELINENNPNNNIVEPNSIDYVFTDPPYGNSIQYYELSFLWNSWLQLNGHFEEEIIINTSQKKPFSQYDQMLLKGFRQVYQTLKPKRYLTVTFHNEKIQIRNSLIRSVVYSGFNLEKILYQSPSKVPAKASLHPYGTPVGDYYIRFSKPEHEVRQTEYQMDKDVQERIMVDAVTTVLAERGEPTSYAWILNTIDTKLIERGYNLISDPEEIKAVLDKHLDKEFVIVDVQEGLNTAKKWWFKNPSSVQHLEKTPLSERVEQAVISVLKRNIIVSFDDVLKEIFLTFTNSLTPETQGVRAILSEYATKLPNGKWRATPEVRTGLEHQTKENELAKLGKQFGFDVYVADITDENRDLVVKELELDIPDEQLHKVRKIDVLWLKNNQIKYCFEIENTTQITEAISRGSNIPYKTERIIVLPDDKERLVHSKFQNVMLKERVEQDNWRVILYSKFDDFLKEKNKTLAKLDALAVRPRQESVKQAKITNY